MGSGISLANDTVDEWSVQVGPDEAAIKVFGAVGAAVGAIAAAAATAGLAAPLTASLEGAAVNLLGLSTSTLAKLIAAASIITGGRYVATAAGLARAVIGVAKKQMEYNGMVKLLPGGASSSCRCCASARLSLTLLVTSQWFTQWFTHAHDSSADVGSSSC